MGHRAMRRPAVVAVVVAVLASGCGGVTSEPRTSGPPPSALVALGSGGPDIDENGFCAGVLIGPRKVLTASRCLRRPEVKKVRAGILDAEGCLVTVRRRARDATSVSVGDASVVRLRGKVPANAAEPLSGGAVPVADDVVVAWGWGPSRPGNGCVPRPTRLRVLADEECADVVGADGLAVYFCAVPEGEVHTCSGDVGGPVLDEQGRLVGITVGGKSCFRDKPARYWSTDNLVRRAG